MPPITEFSGPHRFLSNFWASPLRFGEWTFPTAEHAYQASKSKNPTDWVTILRCPTPGAAKRMGRLIKAQKNWDKVRLENMREILEVKFADPWLRQKLLETGDAELIEGNAWGDTFWGVCAGKGQNHLGKLLMEIRADARSLDDNLATLFAPL